MTHICVMSSHKLISYKGDLILYVNTLYRLSCIYKRFPMVSKGLINEKYDVCTKMICLCRLSAQLSSLIKRPILNI